MHSDSLWRLAGEWLMFFFLSAVFLLAVIGGMFVWSMFCLWCIHMLGQML